MITREEYLAQMRNPSGFLRPIVLRGLLQTLNSEMGYWAQVIIAYTRKIIELEGEMESMLICFLTAYDFACSGSTIVMKMTGGEITKIRVMRELFLSAMDVLIEYYSREDDFPEEKLLDVFHNYLELFGEKGAIRGSSEEIDNAVKAGDKERILTYFQSIGFSIRDSNESKCSPESN